MHGIQPVAVIDHVAHSADVASAGVGPVVKLGSVELSVETLEQLPSGVVVTDPRGRVVYANPHWCRVSGMVVPESADAATSWAPSALTSDGPSPREVFEKAVADGIDEFSWSGCIVGPHGAIVAVTLSSRLVRDDGTLVGVVHLLDDVTAARLEEASLEAQRRATDALVANSPDLIVVLLPDGSWRSMNDAGRASLGYSSLHPVPGDLFDLLHESDRDRCRAELDRVLSGKGDARERLRVRVRSVAGTYRVFEVAATNQVENPAVGGVVVYGRDLTAQSEAELQLAASKRRFGELVELMPDGVWLIDHDGVTQYVNPRVAEMLGVDIDELDGAPLTDYVFEDDLPQLERNLRNRRNGVSGQHEFRFRRKDGSELFAVVSTAVLDPAGHAGTIGVITDITHRREIEQRLSKALQHAQVVGDAKDRFLTRASHELRTPLTAITAHAELLGEQVTGSQREQLGAINRAAARLAEILDQLLDLAQAETEPPALQPVDLTSALETAITAVATSRPLSTWIGPDCTVVADPARLTRALVHLVSLAVKSAELHGGPSPQISAVLTNGNWHVQLRFEAPDAVAEAIAAFFDRPNVQVGSPGAALRLSIAQAFLLRMGGTLGTLRRGPMTVVWFELLAAADTAASPSPSVAPPPSGPARIVYVEDDPANAAIVRSVLSGWDTEITVCPHGPALFEHVDEHGAPTLILLDLNLPRAHGIDVMAEIMSRTDTAHVPVVVISADGSLATRNVVLERGARHVVTKPYSVAALRKIVGEFVAPPEEPSDALAASPGGLQLPLVGDGTGVT